MTAALCRTPSRSGVLRGTVLLLLALAACGDEDGWPPPADVVERGEAIYQQHCAVCHGPEGEGEPGWQTQNPDLTFPAPPHDATGHTWHHGDGLLFRIVRDGGETIESPSFRSRMPAFGHLLSDTEIREVITYLKTLWGPEEREFQEGMSKVDPFP
jgi:mono/diheme cytochrome c family protein